MIPFLILPFLLVSRNIPPDPISLLSNVSASPSNPGDHSVNNTPLLPSNLDPDQQYSKPESVITKAEQQQSDFDLGPSGQHGNENHGRHQIKPSETLGRFGQSSGFNLKPTGNRNTESSGLEPSGTITTDQFETYQQKSTGRYLNEPSRKHNAELSGTYQSDLSGTHQAELSGTFQAESSGTHQTELFGTFQAEHSGAHQTERPGTYQTGPSGTHQTGPSGTVSSTYLTDKSETNHIEAEPPELSAAGVFEVSPAGSGETSDTPEEEPMDKNVSVLTAEGKEPEFNGWATGKWHTYDAIDKVAGSWFPGRSRRLPGVIPLEWHEAVNVGNG